MYTNYGFIITNYGFIMYTQVRMTKLLNIYLPTRAGKYVMYTPGMGASYGP